MTEQNSKGRADPGALAAELERQLRSDIEAIRDAEVRKEAEQRLEKTLAQIRSTSPDAPVVEKNSIDFFRDLMRRRRDDRMERRRKRQTFGLHVDDFGFDRVYWRRVEPLFGYLYDNYWRVDTSGIENVPTEGRALIVANHSGVLPWDAIMLREAVEREHPAQRHVRPLVEDFTYSMPFIGPFLRRIGITRGDPDNARRLLEDEKLVAVFPEGTKGISKPYRDRYRLQRFGRGGTVKLAIATKAPIIPTAIVGAEETYPILGRSEWLGDVVGLPTLPLTPLFPWLGPLGLLPLPSKWAVRFGEPMHLEKLGEKALRDEIRINRLNEELRERVQHLVYELLRERRSTWLG